MTEAFAFPTFTLNPTAILVVCAVAVIGLSVWAIAVALRD